jgi:DNA-binding response OmpR family regulator/HPt (histidine-containing phosphotransfer) domain-containing protein
MAGSPQPPSNSSRDDDPTRLTGARAEFAASLPRRLEVVRAVLRALSEAPTEADRKQALTRRLHALGSAARVLGFASVAEAMTEAEQLLERPGNPAQRAAALSEVGRAIDMVPSLLLGTPPSRVSEAPPAAGEQTQPVNVLVFGTASLSAALVGDAPIEVERTEDPERAIELARASGPNLVIIDADRTGARELVESLSRDPLVERTPVLVVGNFVSPSAAAAYVSLGAARVLPKPVSPDVLARTALELCGTASTIRVEREPLGNRTVEELADRIASEVKKGLVESLEAGGRTTQVAFADGADVMGAVWGAIARVRELVTLRSSGNVRFLPYGPEGAVPVAPWVVEDRRAGERGAPSKRSLDDVGLRGRRLVVADDDPAVVWFLSDLLRAVGAEVIEAHDGQSALARTFEVWPDLVISDVLMPGRDGFSLCHEIHRDVAVRDVPVILLSWKEDLLQRVRELGADANGYLRKETAASTVVERVREVLVPRARVEQRLKAGGEVRGRLDGLTPRLLLELVCRWIPDASVTFRDAVYLHEAHIRDGRVRQVSRSASDGSFERGPKVLAGLLGVNSGRFVVQPDTAPCRKEFDAPLAELLGPPIARARVALAALSAEALPRVVKVRVDADAIGRYLDCTPGSARKLIERLVQGESPRDLLVNADASLGLLEAVLSDLARRGAIQGVEHDDGPVRLSAPPPEPAPMPPPAEGAGGAFRTTPPGLAVATGTGADLGNVDASWSEPPVSSPMAELTASAQAVSDASVAAPAASPVAPPPLPPRPATPPSPAVSGATRLGIAPPRTDVPVFGRTPSSTSEVSVRPPPRPVGERTPPMPLGKPETASEGDDAGWFSFQLDPSAPPPPAAPPPPDQVAISDLADAVVGARPPVLEGQSPKPDAMTPGTAEVFLGSLSGTPPRAEEPTKNEKPLIRTLQSPRHDDDGADPLGDEHLGPISSPRVAVRETQEDRESDASLDAALTGLKQEPAPDSQPRARAVVTPTPARLSAKTSQPAPAEPPSNGSRTLIFSVLAFAAAYAAVRWGLAPMLAPPAEEPAPAVSAVGSARIVHAPASTFTLKSEELEIEPGVDVGAGNGLVEIVGADRDALYVDGTLVGRGPRRLVPSPPGTHEVRVTRGSDDAVLKVEIAAGRRVRVSAPGSSP